MAGNHVDASILYVPIMPETSKLGEAMEQVGKDATESFGKGSSTGFGDKIHDSITKSKDKIKDVFHRSGSDAAEAMADGVKENSTKVEAAVEETGKKAKGKFKEAAKDWGSVLVDAVGPETKKLLGDKLEETVGGALEGVLGENAKWAGKFSHTVADWGFDELKNKLGTVKDAAKDTKAAFADISSGNTLAGISKLVDGFHKVGVEVGDLPDPLQHVINETTDAQKSAQEFADVFKDLPGKIGLVGTAIEALGPVIAGVMGGLDVVKQVIDLAKNFADSHPQSHADADRQSGIPVGPLPGLNQQSVLPFFNSGSPSAGSAPGDIPGMLLPPAGGPSPAAGGSAHDFWGGKSSGFSSPSGTNWNAIAGGESSGKWDTNTGNGFFGGLQFTQPTWEGFGGKEFAPRADLATPDQQKTVAERVLKGQGPGAWPNTFKLGGGGSASGSSFVPSGGGFSASSGQLPGTPPDENSVRSWVAQNFGIPNTFGTGSWENATHPYDGKLHHPGGAKEGYAFDFHGSDQQMDALANWVADNYKDKTLELIHQGPGFDHNREIKNAKYGDVYGADLNAAHRDHVHWAMTQGPDGMAAGGGKMPSGAEHDPLYVTQTAGAAGGGSDTASQGQQLGSGLVDGLFQGLGLDGSVFKTFGGSSNPLQFGLTKIATGLFNNLGGMLAPRGGDGASLPGGGGGGIPGLGALQGLIPGAGVSSGVVAQSPTRGSGGYTTTNNVDNSFTVHQDVQGGATAVQDWKTQANAAAGRGPALTANLPTAGN